MSSFKSISFVKLRFVPPVDGVYYELFEDGSPTGLVYSESLLRDCLSNLENLVL